MSPLAAPSVPLLERRIGLRWLVFSLTAFLILEIAATRWIVRTPNDHTLLTIIAVLVATSAFFGGICAVATRRDSTRR